MITDHDWPALASKLPQSNNAPATTAVAKPGERSDIKCFRCKGNHHIKDCPKKKTKDRDAEKDADASTDEPAAKKAKNPLPAWRYIEPKDLTVPIIDVNEKQWKFCTKCVCRQSGKKGLYLLSHFDSEHKDDYTPPGPVNESNLASVDVPLGIPAATTRDPTSISSADDNDPIEFQGAWCASVSHADVATTFLVRPDESEPDPDADTDNEVVDAEDDLPFCLCVRPPPLVSLSSPRSHGLIMLLTPPSSRVCLP